MPLTPEQFGAFLAAAEAGRGFVALDAGSVGRLLKPLGELELEDAIAIYRDMALAGIDAGLNGIITGIEEGCGIEHRGSNSRIVSRGCQDAGMVVDRKAGKGIGTVSVFIL